MENTMSIPKEDSAMEVKEQSGADATMGTIIHIQNRLDKVTQELYTKLSHICCSDAEIPLNEKNPLKVAKSPYFSDALQHLSEH